ncbi:MAG: hypothetical protein ACYCVH_11185 [Ignavibacteriaceae bacterium]
MQSITSAAGLNDAILELENKRINQESELKHQLSLTLESFKPINFLKSTLREVAVSSNFRKDILKISVGLAASYFSNNLLIGATGNALINFFGGIARFGITNFGVNSSNNIKPSGQSLPTGQAGLLKRLFSRHEKQ